MKLLTRKAYRVGNSAGVVVPKEWMNGFVEVRLVEPPLKTNASYILEILEKEKEAEQIEKPAMVMTNDEIQQDKKEENKTLNNFQGSSVEEAKEEEQGESPEEEKPELTKEEKEKTDLTKLFNFGNK